MTLDFATLCKFYNDRRGRSERLLYLNCDSNFESDLDIN